MRVSNTILILTLFISSSFASSNTLHQARGYQVDRCYKEFSQLACDPECVLTVFPQTNGQLTFRVKEYEKSRTKYSLFTLARFKVANQNANEIRLLEVTPVLFSEMQEKLKTGDYLAHGVSCE